MSIPNVAPLPPPGRLIADLQIGWSAPGFLARRDDAVVHDQHFALGPLASRGGVWLEMIPTLECPSCFGPNTEV